MQTKQLTPNPDGFPQQALNQLGQNRFGKIDLQPTGRVKQSLRGSNRYFRCYPDFTAGGFQRPLLPLGVSGPVGINPLLFLEPSKRGHPQSGQGRCAVPGCQVPIQLALGLKRVALPFEPAVAIPVEGAFEATPPIPQGAAARSCQPLVWIARARLIGAG